MAIIRIKVMVIEDDADISNNKGRACFETCGYIINMLGSMFVSSAADSWELHSTSADFAIEDG